LWLLAESGIQGWDWRYYAEKLREAKYDLKASEIKPYFSLSNMTTALFACAYKLFKLKFIALPDVESYHPDVVTYEVREELADGREIIRAIFLHDNFSRPNKQGGAWMSEYRVQTRNIGQMTHEEKQVAITNGIMRATAEGINDVTVIPIIVNNNNFSKAPSGQDTLLSYDDAITLFHEFGHGLHGMLSDVNYTTLAGTSVLKDFLELPSQLYEHWIGEKEVLQAYAKHHITQEIIPDYLIEKLKIARSFNCGFASVEFLSSALIDQKVHQLSSITDDFDISQFETSELHRLGMPDCMVMRHRPTHFLHLFACSGYAAGYYVYLWAEVLDADGFDAFVESGDIFNADVAARVRRYIYSAGKKHSNRFEFVIEVSTFVLPHVSTLYYIFSSR
jgi:peptidyl-dipeptidase Dcp